jgi:hypothetical protein
VGSGGGKKKPPRSWGIHDRGPWQPSFVKSINRSLCFIVKGHDFWINKELLISYLWFISSSPPLFVHQNTTHSLGGYKENILRTTFGNMNHTNICTFWKTICLVLVFNQE